MRLTIGRKRRQVTIIEVADMTVEVERKWIKNLYLRVSPTNAGIRVSAPMMMSEEAIRTAAYHRASAQRSVQIATHSLPAQLAPDKGGAEQVCSIKGKGQQNCSIIGSADSDVNSPSRE